MTKIAIISTKDRIYGVNKSFELLGINPVKDKDVIFKPNFNTADPPPASSSMETIKQMIIKIKEMGAKSITLAERSGPAVTEEVLQEKGVYELAKELDFKVVDLSVAPKEDYVQVEVEGSQWKDGFLFSKLYHEAECVVETCCLKTHMYGGHFTLSLKNTTGLVPRREEFGNLMKELHGSEHQRKMIADMNAVYNWDLIIMDGIVTFVDGGPMKGTLKEANVFVAGTDKIAVDAVGVALLRMLGTTDEVSKGPIFKQEQIARAVELNLGISTPEEIEFITDGSEESAKLVEKIKEKLAE
ncbi:MAG: DUF362 domain-containing protein [Candidatus Heimdallarchaeota archaeon]|nr:DUF362 domain-containing protein [Candidatus Heimdallarchaeota archaeon]MBY8995057.1 DUF362 domain-containing protein [Candidatus Heimdallarchaeota archaeon]